MCMVCSIMLMSDLGKRAREDQVDKVCLICIYVFLQENGCDNLGAWTCRCFAKRILD